MKPVAFSPAARADLASIALYIADDDPDRAESFVAELVERAKAIAERPTSFPTRDDISPGLRRARHGRYLIFFRDLPQVVRIVRVLHAARDVAALGEQGGFA
jgi:toxin ParE1/3/4